MCDILIMAAYRAKRSKIWASGTLVTHICGAFDLVVFKVNLVSFGAFVSKWLDRITTVSALQAKNGWSVVRVKQTEI